LPEFAGHEQQDRQRGRSAWGGFVMHDLARCRLAARLVALLDPIPFIYQFVNEHLTIFSDGSW
jgi:hypothetical protein